MAPFNPWLSGLKNATILPSSSTERPPYTDEAYDMLIFWVCSQPFARLARTSLATIDLKSSAEPGSHAEKKPLHYSPCNGRSYFWHKRRLFVFDRQRSLGEFGTTRAQAYVSYFGRDATVLREYITEERVEECVEERVEEYATDQCLMDEPLTPKASTDEFLVAKEPALTSECATKPENVAKGDVRGEICPARARHLLVQEWKTCRKCRAMVRQVTIHNANMVNLDDSGYERVD
jgi:hypothetical protein